MQENNNPFVFEISLSILDHLGRNLYRNFVTILGEAISNSWDADASNVWIYVDGDNFVIKDDGIGMDFGDFQGKFLRVGYSKRKNDNTLSAKGRPFIGRKGIGKLALLSCAEKVSIISKKENGEYIGGTINNSILDQVIKDDLKPDQYPLEPLDLKIFAKYIEGHNQGTVIHFENVRDGIKNSVDFLKKITALYFRFSLIDTSFNIYINDDLITLEDVKDLSDKTQYLWSLNNFSDPFIDENLSHIEQAHRKNFELPEGISGFVASVLTPKNLSILGTGERVSLDLFVNGRLRERDILKNTPTARIAESYLYGQVHYNALDKGEDKFTSSREGVVADDPEYQEFLSVIKGVVADIVNDWDKLRVKNREEGDPENERITAKNIPMTTVAQAQITEWKDREVENKRHANINIDIMRTGEDISYLGMDTLTFLADNTGTANSMRTDAKEYKPLRNAVMHTSLLTDAAKLRLTTVYENIKARIKSLINQP